MRPLRSQPTIRPQISTMPRPQTEAAAYLDIYKVVTERQRLEQELAGLEQRRDRIVQRLTQLEQQTQALTAAAQTRRETEVQLTARPQTHAPTTENYDLVYLDY